MIKYPVLQILAKYIMRNEEVLIRIKARLKTSYDDSKERQREQRPQTNNQITVQPK